MTSTQSALVGNGKLLVSLDGTANLLGASWPRVDSLSQLREYKIVVPGVAADQAPSAQAFLTDTLVETVVGDVRILDEVLADRDVWVRSIEGAQGDPLIYVAPQIDGRIDDQTIYFDQDAAALLTYHRRGWIAIAGDIGAVVDWQCSVGAGQTPTDPTMQLTGERIASRVVHGYLRIAGGDRTRIIVAFADSREAVLEQLIAARSYAGPTRPAVTPDGDPLLRQSRNVIRLLTSVESGGVLAGPPLQVDIASEPGYAAVWGRDAAWTELGSLAAGDFDRVRHYLEFAFRVQSPEGLWLHRHHTDYSLGSSWGLHQLDETGLILHLLACYLVASYDEEFARQQRDGVRRAAEFLVRGIQADGLPLPTTDIWEEREGRSAYACASFIGGLRAAAFIESTLEPESDAAARWSAAAEALTERVLDTFWSEEEGRFIKAVHSRAALQLDDPDRTDLPSSITEIEPGGGYTPLPQYPNWVTGPTLDRDLTFDMSVLALTVPYGIVPADDPRMVSTVERLRAKLWSPEVGGFRRYEGDTYGGGNVWPLATMWVACWEASRGNFDETASLLGWMRDHLGPNNMIPEQVHKVTGAPVAALPMAWSHGMVLLATAALEGRNVWDISAVRARG